MDMDIIIMDTLTRKENNLSYNVTINTIKSLDYG